VVFDTAAPTERHETLLDYKANREEMPDDIRSNLPYIRRIIEALNIPILESDGYEADDVIGTLAKKAEMEGYTTFMVTPDKDFGQLVTERIIMYKPGRGGDPPEKLGPKEICARWGLQHTEQVKDILGLMGDAVDNIPGIPGIGEKTAMKLVQQFGSLEGVIEGAAQLKGKQQENVIAFAEQGRLSKMLATINIEAPVELDHEACTWTRLITTRCWRCSVNWNSRRWPRAYWHRPTPAGPMPGPPKARPPHRPPGKRTSSAARWTAMARWCSRRWPPLKR
jgi:DNA polymerase-1